MREYEPGSGDKSPHGQPRVVPYPMSVGAPSTPPAAPAHKDLVSLCRTNNSAYKNLVAFSSPKVSPVVTERKTMGDTTVILSEDNMHESRSAVSVTSENSSTMSSPTRPNPLQAAASHYRFKGMSVIQPVLVKSTTKANTDGFEHLIDHWMWDRIYESWAHGYLKILLIWATWMASGTVFYAIRNKMGWAKGFYMTVNVGYSIGSSYPRELDRVSMWFSIFNILVGVLALGVALNAFAHNILNSDKAWYVDIDYTRDMSDQTLPWHSKVKKWADMNKYKLYTIFAFVLWGVVMVLWASYTFRGWSFQEVLYFSVSSLSTGGLYPMPEHTERYNLAIAGVFICFGVPLTCVAMGNLAALLLKFGDPEKDKHIIRGQVTKEEIDMMKEFGIDDGDKFIDRAEFILLCAVRLGAATPELIEEINKRFATLDTGRRGALTREEMLQERAGSSMLLQPKDRR